MHCHIHTVLVDDYVQSVMNGFNIQIQNDGIILSFLKGKKPMNKENIKCNNHVFTQINVKKKNCYGEQNSCYR